MRKHLPKIGIVALVVAGGLAASALALAEHAHHGGKMKKHVSAFIEDALDAAHVTPAERARVRAARDRVFVALEQGREDRGANFAEVASLFQADRLDAARVARLRARHEAHAKQMGDAIEQALTEAHDALTPAERQAVAAYVREHRPDGSPGGHMRGFRAQMMKRFASARLDDALDAAQVSSEQRAAIYAARDQLFQAIEESRPHERHERLMDRMLQLFVADRVDPAAIASLRSEQQAAMKKVGDAMVQAAYDVHDALTSEQRKAIVAWAQAQHARHATACTAHGG